MLMLMLMLTKVVWLNPGCTRKVAHSILFLWSHIKHNGVFLSLLKLLRLHLRETPKQAQTNKQKKKKNTKAMCACACMCVMCVCVSCVHACVFQATCWTSGNLRRSVQVKNFIIVARFLALVSECHKVDTYADKCTLLTDTTDKSIMRIHPSLI